MSTLTYPNVIAPNTTADATQVESNFLAVATIVNGNIDATNSLTDVPVAQTSASISAGSSSSLSRADHKHVIQCVEQLSSDPSSGNFDGRMYFNTSTHKVRQLLSGAWQTVTNQSATELVHHSAQHVGGGVDVLSPQAVMATKSGNISIPDTTVTALAFNATDVYDTATMHDTVTNNTRLTLTQNGIYSITANLAWAANGVGNRWAWIRVNGGSTVIAESSLTAISSGDNPCHSLTADYKAGAGDYVELYVYQNSTGALNILGTGSAMVIAASRNAPCFFSARWVGAGV